MSSPQQSPQPLPPKRRFVHSIPQVAGDVGISERTLWRLIRAGKVKVIYPSIGRTAITDAERERLLTQGVA